jgi:phage shock protein A
VTEHADRTPVQGLERIRELRQAEAEFERKAEAAIARVASARMPAPPPPAEDLAGQISALAFRLGLAETSAANAEDATEAARQEVREVREQLTALGQRVSRVEGRVTAVELVAQRIETAVVAVTTQVTAVIETVGSLKWAAARTGALTVLGAAAGAGLGDVICRALHLP